MTYTIQVQCNDKIYLRDPQSSELGRRIISASIEIIDELGFEKFTFRKLAIVINSTEASIYRYFENKHKLLVYLTSWYWAWLEYVITFKTNNITDPMEQMEIIIQEIGSMVRKDDAISHINEETLNRIVVSESTKAYLTKAVDDEAKLGYFGNYRSLCSRVAKVIKDINPDYPYPVTMASNLLETAHEQTFFSMHLPYLTDINYKDENNEGVLRFLRHLFTSTVLGYKKT
ncbi:MAG: TetR/AcrR family transcriptional regulator [Cryomorphaceae bacterium]|nr:TetR/AcrR family transcriptional regulator [Cryomorphaceae bacterium]